MSKCQTWTILFCLLMTASIAFAQAAKTSFDYAPLIGWGLGIIFCTSGLYSALKAYANK